MPSPGTFLRIRPAKGKQPMSYVREIVVVGDEHGIQGRFDQHIGQVIYGWRTYCSAQEETLIVWICEL